ncbi:MAG: oligosaccharide flippase family protein [Candidatus Peribacteraceae bacterium]|nr:oligosaccharide flippase family protein [Candidatus Peribacteraceae bacterium]
MQPEKPSSRIPWDRLSRRFHINVRYFAENSAILTLNYALSVLGGLITGYLVARVLPAELYGGYRFGLAVTGFVSLITLPSLESAVAREIAKKGPAETPLQFTILANAVLCLVGALALVLIIPLLGIWERESLAPLLLVMAAFFIPLQLSSTFFSGIVTGTGEFRRLLWVNLVQTLIIVCLVPLTLFFTQSLPALYAVAVGVPGLVVVAAFWGQLGRFPSRERSWRVIKYGTLLSLNTIPVAIASQLDSFIIAGMFGLKQLALFQVAILVPEQLKVWFKSLMPVSFSRLATLEDSWESRRKVRNVTGLLMLAVGVGVAVYATLAPWLCALLFPNYAGTDIVPLTQLSAALLVVVPCSLLSQYLEAHGMVRSLQWANWLSMILFVIALFVLTPTMGLAGAILARALLRGVFALANLFSLLTVPLVRD